MGEGKAFLNGVKFGWVGVLMGEEQGILERLKLWTKNHETVVWVPRCDRLMSPFPCTKINAYSTNHRTTTEKIYAKITKH